MPAPPSDTALCRMPLWVLLLPAVAAAVYAYGHLAWYRGSPLGIVPVVDEEENLAFAEAIARGIVPREPFYRAPGYAVLLAGLRVFGVPTVDLFRGALVLGAALHVVNTLLAARIARAWFGEGAALAAGLLFALNPVFVHYSTQALDAVPALTFFLGGLAVIASELVRNKLDAPRPARWALASVLWAVAVAMRPNYLLVWLTLPVLAAGWCAGARWRAALVACSGAVVFLAVATWQWRVSGQAGFLPWQGTYNLWAANEPGTHGRYYVQKHPLPASMARQNPARAESIYFYRQETGVAPLDIRALNTHWRQRFLAHVTDHPFAWLAHLGRKAYALVNHWEQYNNKTFAFHKARSPWLRWNPLGWGILFVLGIAGAARFAAADRRAALALAVIVAAVALSVLLFFVSARFRLPLAAVAAILAGGAIGAPRFWQTWPLRRRLALGAGLAAAATLSFSPFDAVNSRITFVEDHALLARTAATIGEYEQAWTSATAALQLQPAHRNALRFAVSSYFNLLVLQQADARAEPAWRDACTRLLSLRDEDVPELCAVAAVALWRAGRNADAAAEWRRLGPAPSGLAARMLAGDASVSHGEIARVEGAAWEESLVRLAAAHFHIRPPAGVTLGPASRAAEIVQRVFGRTARLP